MPRLGWKILLLAGVFVIAASTILIQYQLRNEPVTPALANDLRRLVGQHPHLQAMYDVALKDGRITLLEAEALIKAAEAPTTDVKDAASPGK